MLLGESGLPIVNGLGINVGLGIAVHIGLGKGFRGGCYDVGGPWPALPSQCGVLVSTLTLNRRKYRRLRFPGLIFPVFRRLPDGTTNYRIDVIETNVFEFIRMGDEVVDEQPDGLLNLIKW